MVITGGGRELRRTTSEQLALDGYRGIVVACTSDSADKAVAEIRADNVAANFEARAVDLPRAIRCWRRGMRW